MYKLFKPENYDYFYDSIETHSLVFNVTNFVHNNITYITNFVQTLNNTKLNLTNYTDVKKDILIEIQKNIYDHCINVYIPKKSVQNDDVKIRRLVKEIKENNLIFSEEFNKCELVKQKGLNKPENFDPTNVFKKINKRFDKVRLKEIEKEKENNEKGI